MSRILVASPTTAPTVAPVLTSPHDQTTSTPLTAAVSASGLVDGLALHRAVSHVVAQRPTSDGDHDRRLGERLVETGLLNRWQLEQLAMGRTKFTLGPYLIVDSIARGGMGHVFKAEHDMLGRTEAVKVLPRSKSTPEAIASFRNEIRSQAALDHPNLVRVSNAGRDGETYYLVTEYVPGIDLRRLVHRHGPIAESVAAWALSQAASAIDHAHRRGLVHRDVKPGNLLLTPTGGVKVTDLGLAWSLDATPEPGDAYAVGKIVGTSDYLAPEAIRMPEVVRPESDIYGLGCTLYYAVTGKVPYPGGTHLEKMRRRLREDPLDPEVLAPGLSPPMGKIIRQAMARRPGDRPESAAALAESLKALCDRSDRQRLAVAVTDATTRRVATDDTKPPWASGEADELPETVGFPLRNASSESLAPGGGGLAPPPVPPALTEGSATANHRRRKPPAVRVTPNQVTWAALAVTALLLLSTALRGLLG